MADEWRRVVAGPGDALNLGTHALQPFGRGRRAPEDGLQIAGDGQATKGGRSLGHRLSFEAFQGNVDGARRLDATHPASRPRLESMRWGSAGLAPVKAAGRWARKQLGRLPGL